MRCPRCGAENPDEANFCLKCGARLAASPASPLYLQGAGGTEGGPASAPDTIPADALSRLVPREYADRLRATRGTVGGERRMVTMLFSDVKGSTTMGEQLDPEDVMDIMNGAFEVLIPPVYRYEGTLARLMGDAILAFFGAPLSHEDDAARAIRAGLEIVAGAKEYAARLERERGIKGFNVRVGINTGLVVVGEVGSDLRVEYTAMGDAVNLAARMEQNAPVGGVLISHDTYLQVRGLFKVQALEPIGVKGKAEPVRVYVVQRARPRSSLWGLASRGLDGVETRMIGREGELKHLQDAFRRTAAGEDAQCQVVTIVGEAGVGKTRLLCEFESWLGDLPQSTPHLAGCFHARAQAEQQAMPFSLLRDLFLLHFDIQDGDPVQAASAKLEAGIGRMLGADEQGRMKAHLIGQLLGFDFGASPFVQAVGDDARQLRDRALIYIEEFLGSSALDGTAVALFEDIHWADDSSLDAIAALAKALARKRLLIVCLARPVLFERRPQGVGGGGQACYTRLDLQPLSQRDSLLLVDEILKNVEQAPAALRDMIVASAEGNPLYVEELIKVLIEQKVIIPPAGDGPWSVEEARLAELRVPPTLLGVLQARLDGLPFEQRAILQQAAVVGSTFWDRVVARIGERTRPERGCPGESEPSAATPDGRDQERLPAMLAALRGRELVARHETSAFAGSQEFVFKHAALRKVAYETILKKVRRGYHSLVADWLIEQGSGRAGEYAGLIAHHLELAGRAEEALGHLRQAGGQAAARFANAEAVGYYTRALALLDHPALGSEGTRRAPERVSWEPQRLTEEQYAFLLAREAVYELLGRRDEQAGDLAALRALAGEMGDARRRAEVARRQSRYHESLGDFAAALAHGEEAVRWAEQAADPADVAQGLILCAPALWCQGRYDQARVLYERALALARRHGDRNVEARALLGLGLLAPGQADLQAAIDYNEQALHLLHELGALREEARTLNNLAVVMRESGRVEGALRQFERALAIFREIGDRRAEAYALANLSDTCAQVGLWAQGRDLDERALALVRLLGDRRNEGIRLFTLGINSLSLGDAAAARLRCEQALLLCRQTGDRLNEGNCLLALGLALGELADLDSAAACFQGSLDVFEELGFEGAAVNARAGLAEVAARQGRSAEALAYTREALAWMATHNLDWVADPVRAYLSAATALNAAGRPAEREEAAAALAAARTWVQARAARLADPEMRASFESIPLHAKVLQEVS